MSLSKSFRQLTSETILILEYFCYRVSYSRKNEMLKQYYEKFEGLESKHKVTFFQIISFENKLVVFL